ncbi:nucleotide-binding domain-containing protein, partial [Microstroma glucosiphilum]
RLAIIGSGPSAFYSAARLLSSPTLTSEDPSSLTIQMFERLPVPNGLVRWGVAPDHLDVKNVEHKFAEVAKDPRFRFCGNVNVVQGTEAAAADGQRRTGYQYPHAIQLPLDTLARHYTHVLFSYGCSSSRPLGIPGSSQGELANVHSALDFVNWYNGHPAAHDEELLSREPWRRVELTGGKSQMDVIGAGNVALDVARIVLRASAGSLLAASGSSSSSSGRRAKEALETSDVPEAVLQHLSESRINHVDISARRGPAQAAFTNKELREMLALPGVGFEPVDSKLLQRAEAQVAQQEEESRTAAQAGNIDPDAAAHSAGEARVRKRLLSLLAKGSKTSSKEADRNWRLNFYRAPAAFLGAQSSSSEQLESLKAIQWTSTSYPSTPVAESEASKATSGPAAPWGNEPAPTSSEGVATLPTDSTSSTPDSTPRVPGSAFETKSDLVVSSVGYRGTPLTGNNASTSSTSSGHSSSLLPWDNKRGVVPNLDGRVVSEQGEVLPNIYVSGWLARGPVGVIASTMHDAYSVADTILADHLASSSAS